MQEKKIVIRGVAHDTNVAKLAARGVPDEPGVAYRIFAALADANIDVDMIVQSASVQKDKKRHFVYSCQNRYGRGSWQFWKP